MKAGLKQLSVVITRRPELSAELSSATNVFKVVIRFAAFSILIVALFCPATWGQDAVSSDSAASVASKAPATPDVNEIMRRAVEKDIVNWQAAKDYTFLERTQENRLDDGGHVKSTKTETSEIIVLYDEPFERLVARDDKPLPPKEQKKQDDKFDEETRKRANETPEEREKRIRKYEKEREEGRAFVREILNAYAFTLAGEEVLHGRKAWVVDGEPRADFKPQRKEARFLPKIKPRFWIDQQDYTWAKVRGDVTDTISFGLVIARLHKGTQFELQQMRVNDEVWLPVNVDVHIDARIALLKNMNEEVHVTYSDYKKFRTETKITPVVDANQLTPGPQ
jgi:hypothetical protein